MLLLFFFFLFFLNLREKSYSKHIYIYIYIYMRYWGWGGSNPPPIEWEMKCASLYAFVIYGFSRSMAKSLELNYHTYPAETSFCWIILNYIELKINKSMNSSPISNFTKLLKNAIDLPYKRSVFVLTWSNLWTIFNYIYRFVTHIINVVVSFGS